MKSEEVETEILDDNFKTFPINGYRKMGSKVKGGVR